MTTASCQNEEADGSREMSVDHGRLNGTASPVPVTVLNIALLTKELIKKSRDLFILNWALLTSIFIISLAVQDQLEHLFLKNCFY